MKIDQRYKVRSIAGENILLLPGAKGGDMSKVMAFNPTAKFLWDHFVSLDFEVRDVKEYLLEQYEVEEVVAERDAEQWVATLRENHLFVEE